MATHVNADPVATERDTARAMSRENVEIVREIYSEAAEARRFSRSAGATCISIGKRQAQASR
jgi:hypothetical protein